MREYYAAELTETIDEFDYGCPPVPTWMVYQVGIATDLPKALCINKCTARILIDALSLEEEKIYKGKKHISFKQKLRKNKQL